MGSVFSFVKVSKAVIICIQIEGGNPDVAEYFVHNSSSQIVRFKNIGTPFDLNLFFGLWFSMYPKTNPAVRQGSGC